MIFKIVYNDCFGGFHLSEAAIRMLGELKNLKYDTTDWTYSYKISSKIDRWDKDLVTVVETLGTAASGEGSNLKVASVDITGFIEIKDYDGKEHVWFGGYEL